jgi:predicted ATPase
MIDAIHLRHFKCFDSLDLPLRKLTLLTGLNSTGKSSAIQSLLSVHQTLQLPGPPPHLLLNGDFVSLGSVHDVLDRLTGRGQFEIGITSGDTRVMWEFDAAEKNLLTAPVSAARCYRTGQPVREVLRNWYPPCEGEVVRSAASEIRQLLHVSTERIGPRDTYEADVSASQGDRLGSKGEYTAWFLHKNEDLVVPLSLRLGDGQPQLKRQVERWMQQFFPGAGLRVSQVQVAGPPLMELPLMTLGFRTSIEDDFYRPQSVGYGLTHVLPILVGGLAAATGRMFIVENPEAHLHPAAQAQMASFLASVAAAGAQVIIESHSDHILNGLRRTVKEGVLTPDEVAIHYFQSRDSDSHAARVTSPRINASGQINEWPVGFFDQLDRDLEALVSWE